MSSATTHSRPIEDGWLREWLVLGPFHDLVTEHPALVTAEKMPGLLLWGGEQSPDGWPEAGRAVPPDEKEWRRLKSLGPTCALDTKREGTWPRWFYTATYLRAYEQVQAKIEISCNGCFMLRSDGRPVLWHQGWPRDMEMPPDTEELTLPEGCHLLLFKVATYGGRPTFAMRLKDSEGNPFTGTAPVAVRTEPLQSMRLDVPARGKKLSAPADMPSVCVAPKAGAAPRPLSRGEPPWSGSVPASRFRTLDGYRARWQTSVSAAYTDKELQFLVECENHRPSAIREPFPWLSDHVFILLDPDHAHRESVSVLVNLHGETWTRGLGTERLEVRVEARNHGWAGVLRIPFSELAEGSIPPRGERWGFNAIRVCPDASDGLTCWCHGDMHAVDLREEKTAGEACAGINAGTPWWPRRPRRLGHLEFGQNDLTVEETRIEGASPGRLQLRVNIDNRGGKARSFLRYRICGTADTWPEPARSESELDTGEKSWLLPAGSSAGTTVPIAPLPPGNYEMKVEIEVPGRDFHQSAGIPFTCPRELLDDTGGEVRERPGAQTEDGPDRALTWTFYLAEEPPHELLLTAAGTWPEEGLTLHWNGRPLDAEYLPADARLQAAVPASILREGENELMVKTNGECPDDLPDVDLVSLRLCESARRNVTRGEVLYHFHAGIVRGAKAKRGLLSTSPRGVPHESCELVELEDNQTLSFPILLDRPGGTLDMTHADFMLQILFVVCPGTHDPPTGCCVSVNDEDLETQFGEEQRCFLGTEPATLWTLRGSVPENALRNGINTLTVRYGSSGGGQTFLQGARLSESRRDDPQVVRVPGSATVRERWEVELWTERSRTLQGVGLPPHIKAAFECPLDTASGASLLSFEADSPGLPGTAELEFDDVSACFTTPAIQPLTPLLPRGDKSGIPSFSLADGSIEFQLAAMRGRARAGVWSRFTADTERVTIPHAPENRAASFRSLIRTSLFMAGAETEQDNPGALPPVTRRDGLPSADIAVIDCPGGGKALCRGGHAEPELSAVASVLLSGVRYPSPHGPVFPEGPTGHFSGTPWGKFDILNADDVTAELSIYRLLLPAQTSIPPELLKKLRGLVEEGGCWLVLTPAHAKALQSFGVEFGSGASGRRIRFHATSRLTEQTVVVPEARYSVLQTPPEKTLATCKPGGDALMGQWKRGRGSVFALGTQPDTGEAELELFRHCIERILQVHDPLVLCDNELVNLSVFPEELDFPSPSSVDGLSPLRIYAAHCGWWQRHRPPVECTLTIQDREMPLALPKDTARAIYASGRIAVMPEDGRCYVENVSRRESGYEIQVRGSGTHDIIVLPLSGRIAAVNCQGERVEARPAKPGGPAVRISLDVAELTRFQVALE